MKSDPVLLLPDLVVSPLDLGRIQREIFDIDQTLNASKGPLSFVSNELNTIIKSAEINLLKAEDRDRLIKQLQFVRRTAPSVQVSFASEPGKQALRPLIRWFRQNGHPNTLLNVGVQPEIGGGCVVRTSKKVFDFSIEKILKASRNELAKKFV